MAEFSKCVRGGRSRSATPERRDVTAAVRVEHREKNIFSSRSRRGNSKTSSTSSQGKGGSSNGAVNHAKNFVAIKEYEDEEDSMVYTRGIKQEDFDKVVVLKSGAHGRSSETPSFKHDPPF